MDLSDSSASGTASASLTGAGADAFGNFYPEGDPLDDISFTASLGGSAACADGQGTGGSTAGTGAGGGNSAAAELRNSGGTGGTGDTSGESNSGSNGSVNDQLAFGDSAAADGQNNSGSQFRIKDASVGGASGISDSTIILLLLAAFVVAGTTVTSFGSRNPN